MRPDHSRPEYTTSTVFRAFVAIMIMGLCPALLTGCNTLSGQTASGSDSRTWDYSQAGNAPPTDETPRTLYEYYAQNKNMPPPASQQQNVPAVVPGTTRPVKVGLLLPLSGNKADLGAALMNAAQMAIFDVGYQNFELIPEDTGGTAGGAQNAARKALQSGAELLIGPVFADEVRAVKPIAAGAGVPVIGFSTDWTLAGGGTFIMGFLPFDQIERIALYAQRQYPGTLGVIAPDTEYGRAVAGALKVLAQSRQWPAPQIAMFDPGTKDMDSVVRNFVSGLSDKGAGGRTLPPVSKILLPVGADQAAQLSDLLTRYGLPPERSARLGTGLLDDPGAIGNPALRGIQFAAPSPGSRKNFERRYFENFSAAPPRLATLGYDAAALAAVLAKRGLESAGKPGFDSASIMNPNGFAGLDGIFRFRSNGIAERGLAVLSYEQGGLTMIEDAPKSFQKQNRAF